jgi:hypothetical protein
MRRCGPGMGGEIRLKNKIGPFFRYVGDTQPIDFSRFHAMQSRDHEDQKKCYASRCRNRSTTQKHHERVTEALQGRKNPLRLLIQGLWVSF